MPNNNQEWGQFIDLDLTESKFDIYDETNVQSIIEIANETNYKKVLKDNVYVYPIPVDGHFMAEHDNSLYQVVNEYSYTQQLSLTELLKNKHLPQVNVDFFELENVKQHSQPMIKSHSFSGFEQFKSNERKASFLSSFEEAKLSDQTNEDATKITTNERVITVTPDFKNNEENQPNLDRKRKHDEDHEGIVASLERFTVSPNSTAIDYQNKFQKLSKPSDVGMFFNDKEDDVQNTNHELIKPIL